MQGNKKTVSPEDRCVILVKVVPRSYKSSISHQGQNSYKIKLMSPPVEGSANKELLELLARELSIPTRNLEIVTGTRSRNKRIRISGMNEKKVAEILASVCETVLSK